MYVKERILRDFRIIVRIKLIAIKAEKLKI